MSTNISSEQMKFIIVGSTVYSSSILATDQIKKYSIKNYFVIDYNAENTTPKNT